MGATAVIAIQSLRTTGDKIATSFCCLLAILASGCRPVDEFAPVEGTLRVAGLPAGNILVIFTPESDGSRALPRSAAVTDQDGHFELRIDGGRPGALVGQHRVTLEDMDRYAVERTDKPPSAMERLPDLRVPASYATAATTPLAVTVSADGENVDLEVPDRAGRNKGRSLLWKSYRKFSMHFLLQNAAIHATRQAAVPVRTPRTFGRHCCRRTETGVIVPDPDNLQFMSFWLAKDAGFFAEPRIEVELVVPDRHEGAKQMVFEGEADCAVLPPPMYLELIGERFPLVLVANLLENDAINLVVRRSIAAERQLDPATPLKERLAKLSGMRIGAAPNPPTRLRRLPAWAWTPIATSRWLSFAGPSRTRRSATDALMHFTCTRLTWKRCLSIKTRSCSSINRREKSRSYPCNKSTP